MNAKFVVRLGSVAIKLSKSNVLCVLQYYFSYIGHSCTFKQLSFDFGGLWIQLIKMSVVTTIGFGTKTLQSGYYLIIHQSHFIFFKVFLVYRLVGLRISCPTCFQQSLLKQLVENYFSVRPLKLLSRRVSCNRLYSVFKNSCT